MIGKIRTIVTVGPASRSTDILKKLKENDVIICVGSNGGTQTVDVLVVNSATGATPVTVVNGT